MKCIYCGHLESKVVDSRPTDEGSSIRRRRECLSCKKRFTTYEKIDSLPLLVIKKNGDRVPFDADKIKMGIIKACEKRPVPMHEIEALVASVEKEYIQLPASGDHHTRDRRSGDARLKRA